MKNVMCDNCGREVPVVGMHWYAKNEDWPDGRFEQKWVCIDCYGSRREGPLYPHGEHRT